jgi:hypothetical protein
MFYLILFLLLLFPNMVLAQVPLTKVTSGTASITVRWDFPSASLSLIDEFVLQISDTETGVYAVQSVIPKTSQTYVYATSALAVGVKKYFRVLSRKQQPNPTPDQESTPSNVVGLEMVSGTTPPPGLLPPPTNVRIGG